MDKCNHDIEAIDTTISLFPRKTMSMPDCIRGICVLCRKSFLFIREQDTFVLKEEKDENI